MWKLKQSLDPEKLKLWIWIVWIQKRQKLKLVGQTWNHTLNTKWRPGFRTMRVKQTRMKWKATTQKQNQVSPNCQKISRKNSPEKFQSNLTVWRMKTWMESSKIIKYLLLAQIDKIQKTWSKMRCSFFPMKSLGSDSCRMNFLGVVAKCIFVEKAMTSFDVVLLVFKVWMVESFWIINNRKSLSVLLCCMLRNIYCPILADYPRWERGSCG